jgi:hypothetical protein
MSNRKAIDNEEKKVRPIDSSGWSKLAEATKAELKTANERVRKLKAALRIFTDNAERDAFYPGSTSGPSEGQNG